MADSKQQVSGVLRKHISELDDAITDYITELIFNEMATLKDSNALHAAIGELLESHGFVDDAAQSSALCSTLYQELSAQGLIDSSKAQGPSSAVADHASEPTTFAPKRMADIIVVESKKVSPRKKASDVYYRPSREEIEADMERIMSESNRVFEASSKGCSACELCARIMPLTRHHLIPKTTHSKYKKKGFSDELLNTCIDICRPCHNAVHACADEATLASDFNTREKILAREDMQKFLKYIRKQPTFTKADSLNPTMKMRK